MKILKIVKTKLNYARTAISEHVADGGIVEVIKVRSGRYSGAESPINRGTIEWVIMSKETFDHMKG